MRLCFEGNKSIGVRAHLDSRGGVGAALFSLQLEVLPFPFSPELPNRTLRCAGLLSSERQGKAGLRYCRREAEAAEPSADNGAWREEWEGGRGEMFRSEGWEQGMVGARQGREFGGGEAGLSEDGVGGGGVMAWTRWAMLTKKKHGPKCGGRRGCKKGDVTGNNSAIVG